jgi:pyridoxal phosphate enzyme (YggS family)
MSTEIYQAPVSLADIQANLAHIQERIATACQAAGRDPQSVRLLPVSKTKPNDILRLAYAAGVREFGENKVQEAKQKAEELTDLTEARWCVIGHLQTNKAKYVARFAHEFQALDNLRVAAELDRCLKKENRTLDVFVQVNSSNEPQKFGLPPEDVEVFIAQLPQFDSLNVKGLMTLAEFSSSEERVRACFVRMRELQEKLQRNLPAGISVKELSMGMSGDFELAIAEGATVVRVGQAIFGARATPDSFYWPN